MHAFLLSLIGLGSSKCLFCGNVSYSYMTGVRARLDYIYFDGKDSCTCRLTSAIEVTKGFPSFTKAYRLSYPALDGVLQGYAWYITASHWKLEIITLHNALKWVFSIVKHEKHGTKQFTVNMLDHTNTECYNLESTHNEIYTQTINCNWPLHV